MHAKKRLSGNGSNGTRGKFKLSRMLFALATAATVSTGFMVQPAVANGGGLTVVGLTADQRLVWFRTSKPRTLFPIGKVTGLNATDTALIGIDYRVQDGQLYGVGNGGGIYTIDPRSGAATHVSSLTVALDGNSFGVDFNPAANALRIVSNTGQNLRHPFAGPLAGQTQTDDPLDYPPATPLNTSGPTATGIAGAAYTNNDLSMDTGTTLFDLDTNMDQIAIQSPPNNGSLVATGKLTVDAGPVAGFDIYSALRRGVSIQNTGYATINAGGFSGFYLVRLNSGKVTLLGRFNKPIVDIAIPLAQ